jgi:hypothetical protein
MSAATAASRTNPFPGLRPFREDEEYLFFGRENQVDAMVNKLAGTRFLAVVGTSGSGKSSLVNCGLRPALRLGLMARAGTAWRMAQFRPGSHPIGAMARALAQNGVLFRDHAVAGLSLAEIVETSLRMSKLGLIDIFEQAALDKGVNLLVVVDQFEELFRYRQIVAAGRTDAQGISEDTAAFVNLLLEAKEQATCPIFVVLTMRSDFLGDCTRFPGLAEAINAGQYLVPRMTRDERRSAIVGPVGVGGAEIAPVLVTRLVNDVGDNPDQLSILQHALNRTWARWQHEGGGQGPLDLPHYEAIGSMSGALDGHAERAYAELSCPRQRQICEKLFKALTDKATDPRGVRRPITLRNLCELAKATLPEVTDAELTAVIDVFRKPSRSFLMPPAGEAIKAETVIDISHESLMRVWKRLITWADEEARSAEMYRRLANTSMLHAADKAGLWRDPDLQLALDWREKEKPTSAWAGLYQGGFEAAMSFLEKSKEARDFEVETKVLEARKAETRRRRQILALGGIAIVFFALGCVALYLLQSARNAQRLAEENLSKYKEEQRRSHSLSRQKQEALLTAGKLSDSLKDLAVIDLEDKDNSVQIVSPLFKNLLLNYIATVEKKTLNDHDLPPEVELNLRLSRVTVALMTGDLDGALQECDDVLAQLPGLPVQDPTYRVAFFRLKGDILDEKAFRARFSPRNDRKAEWIRAIQCFQRAADSCDSGSDDGRLLLATLQVRIGHVIDYLSKTYCPGQFGETNESSKETDSAKEALAAAPDPTAFLDFNHQAFERINAALVIVKRFVLTHLEDLEGLRAEADAENKLGNLAKERYESGFVANAADMQQLIATAIKHYNEALATRERLLRIKNDSPSDQVAVALIQANLGETYGLLIERDLSWISQASKYLDSRIETCNQLLKIDPNNPYFKSILRRGYLNKINFLVETVKTPAALSEAHDLLSYTLYLGPETIREEDLANLEQLCNSLDLQTQCRTCLTARKRLLQLKSNP